MVEELVSGKSSLFTSSGDMEQMSNREMLSPTFMGIFVFLITNLENNKQKKKPYLTEEQKRR